MPIDDATAEQIERMRQVLPTAAPALWGDFAPPASEAHIDELRETLGEWPLPDSIETWLRFTDGLFPRAAPIIECSFVSARTMADFYTHGLEFIDTTVDDPGVRIIAPSFPLLLAAIVDLGEAGLLDDGDHPEQGRFPDGGWITDVSAHWRSFFEQSGWPATPVPPYERFDRWDRSPAEWGPVPEL